MGPTWFTVTVGGFPDTKNHKYLSKSKIAIFGDLRPHLWSLIRVLEPSYPLKWYLYTSSSLVSLVGRDKVGYSNIIKGVKDAKNHKYSAKIANFSDFRPHLRS